MLTTHIEAQLNIPITDHYHHFLYFFHNLLNIFTVLPSCWLLPVGYFLYVTSCQFFLSVTSCGLLPVGCFLSVSSCRFLPVSYFLSVSSCWLLPVGFFLSVTSFLLLPAVFFLVYFLPVTSCYCVLFRSKLKSTAVLATTGGCTSTMDNVVCVCVCVCGRSAVQSPPEWMCPWPVALNCSL